ncbi:hypothetical protein KY362_04020 [Candidatus Woesearchaeota archaeon]|nr:hypothetical protein [Candidatus Woesearchaeota archaeon]
MSSKKKIQKFSKSTAGVAVDTVSDYVDIVSQMIAEYFNQRYKITKKVEEIKNATLNTLFSLKRQFVRTMVEVLFLMTGLLALIAGVIMVVSKVIPLEYVLLGYGVLVSAGVMFCMKLKAS